MAKERLLTPGELQHLRNASGLTQQQMADLLGADKGAYKNWELPDRTVPDRVAHQIARLRQEGKLIDSPLARVANIVTHPEMQMKYAGVLPAGNWSDPLESEEFVEVEAKYWKINRWCCEVAGESCFPALQPRDFCIFEYAISPQYGKIVAAANNDHGGTIKRLDWDSSINGPKLAAINPTHDDAEADAWQANAFLVYVRWLDEDGGEMSFYRPDGIKPSQLIRVRSPQS